MVNSSRREFLADVGKGMLIASLGTAMSYELGISPALADEGSDALNFGKLEPLVAAMQETPLNKLLPLLIEKIAAGSDLRTLIAAGALANARSFGGQDYTGYHALMALAPAYEMSKELPDPQRALPVLKVLYRNSQRIQQNGGRKNEVLHAFHDDETPAGTVNGETLREATRKGDMKAAERELAAMVKGPVGEAFNHMQFAIQDEVDVHRVVLAWRSYALLDLAGPEQAFTLLRQSVRYCVETENSMKNNKRSPSGIRVLLPKLLDQYKLLEKTPGDRKLDDAMAVSLSEIVYGPNRDKAADAVAAALAEGFAPAALGEVLSLAANQLVMRDPGRQKADVGKPVGSVHGASVGVHASDSANAWQHIARVSNPRNTFASLIVGAYHTAGQSGGLNKASYPLAENLEKIESKDAAVLLRDTEDAVKQKDQARACALVHRYGELGHPERALCDVMLKFAVSEDGALHAEKYYRTTTEEFATTRAVFRWRHLAALARVTASEYGFPAAGYEEARALLKV